MRLDGRVKKLTKQLRVDQRLPSWLEESIVAHQERHERFLARIPTDLRSAIEEQLRHPRWGGTLWAWESTPFAKWAPEPDPGYQFPRALVDFWASPPRRYFAGHNCGQCGLAVPLYVTWANDPNPPPELKAFPICPACGGRTSFSATSVPGPESVAEGHQ